MREGWEYKKLGEVAVIQSGYTPSSADLSNNGTVPYYKVGDMNAVGNEKYLHYSSAFVDASFKSYPKGSVVFPKNGAAIATNKKRILSQPSVVDLNTAVLIPIKNLNIEFLYYWICKIDFRNITRRGAVPTLDIKTLMQFDFPTPSPTVQSHIVSELDMLSGLIAKHEEQLKAYDELAQSIFFDMFGDPVENEKGWEVKKLGEIGTIITGSTPSTRDENNYSSNDYNFFKPSDIANDTISLLTESEYFISEHAYEQSRKLPIGSVLVTCIGIIGKIGILQKEATCNQQINAVKPNDNSTPLYLAYYISGLRVMLENIANAPVVPIINKGQFSNIQIPLPPLLLQQSFAEKIEAIERQKERIRQSMAEVKTLFDSRMDYYFN